MNILLTSVGRRAYMIDYFKEALAGRGKVFASNSIETYALLQADSYIITPNIYDNGYIEFLLNYCKSNQIEVIISLFDIDLPILAKNKDLFMREGIQIIVSDYNVTKICSDKYLTYEFLTSIGIKQPATFLNLQQAEEALNNNLISFPVIIKPRWGMGSIGLNKALNFEELRILYKRTYEDITSSYLRYESQEDYDNCVLIQEELKGQECGIEILNDLNANFIQCFAKKKIAMRAGETDVAVTVDNVPYIEIAKLISSKLQHVGILDVDVFICDDGSIYILEMNCRFGGQYPFTHNAGVNVPAQLIEWINGAPTNYNLLDQKNSVRSCKNLVPIVF